MLEGKKIDLHLHYDGSIPVDAAWKMAQDSGLYQDMSYKEFQDLMQVDPNCHSLYDYLRRFDAPLALLQTKQHLYDGMKALIGELHQQGFIYAEIRFAPQQHNKQGLTQEEVFLTLHQAVIDAKQAYPDLIVNLIVCLMILGEESATHKENIETLHLAQKYYQRGISAMDLAGAEGMASMEDFAFFFQEANKYGIPFTIHAGESGGADHIESAISLGAKRIGHGVSAIKDEKVMKLLKEKQIPLEMCLTSNVNCEVCDSYAMHPFHTYLEYGIPVTINTDNMTISNTSLDLEYRHVMQEQKLSENDIVSCLYTAIEHAFASDEEKDIVRRRLSL